MMVLIEVDAAIRLLGVGVSIAHPGTGHVLTCNHHRPQRRARVHKMAEPPARQGAQPAQQGDNGTFRKVLGAVQV